MNISEVRIHKLDREGAVKALATVTIDNAFAIHGFKVLQSEDGLKIASPSRKNNNGEFKDVAHPISAEARKQLEDAILKAYNEA